MNVWSCNPEQALSTSNLRRVDYCEGWRIPWAAHQGLCWAGSSELLAAQSCAGCQRSEGRGDRDWPSSFDDPFCSGVIMRLVFEGRDRPAILVRHWGWGHIFWVTAVAWLLSKIRPAGFLKFKNTPMIEVNWFLSNIYIYIKYIYIYIAWMRMR